MTKQLLALAVCFAFGLGCASGPRWESVRQPDVVDAARLLAAEGLGLERDERPEEVPDVPIRKRLRPCCAFGSELRVRLGRVKIPGFQIGNIRSPDEIGRHSYDAGQRGTELAEGREKNGLVYTCRGGFVDIAHVRDYADWTLYLATQIGRRLETGGVIELPDPEGGARRFVLEPIDPEFVQIVGRRPLTAMLAVWGGFQMSLWHEIATWYGWSSIELFSERASAFSPEDVYSNLLGAKIAGAIVSDGGDLSESLFNQAVDRWLSQTLGFLEAVEEERGEAAMAAIDGRWWNSQARLPDDELVIRRSIQTGRVIEPWIVHAARSIPEAALSPIGCGSAPEPHVLRNPSRLPSLEFSEVLRFEVELDAERASHPDLEAFEGRITDRDFERVLEQIRVAARARFGEGADRPD